MLNPPAKQIAGTSTLTNRHQQVVARRVLCVTSLVVAMLFIFLLDLATGASNISFSQVLSGLLNSSELTTPEAVIIWELRLPYSVTALLVGLALGLAGAEMQTALNNPLASPFTLGLSSAATLGASLALAFNWNDIALTTHLIVPLFAFAFAAGATALILFLARVFDARTGTIILFGISLTFGFNAMVALVQYLSDADTVQQIVFWGMGSLARTSWEKIAIIFMVLVICVPASIIQVWRQTMLRCGEEHAKAAGVDVDRLRRTLMLRVSLLSAIAICFVGEIGFIGLVGPHIGRLLVGEDHRFYLPASALSGAVLMLLASLASKTLVAGAILPVGMVTALVGVPLFVLLIFTYARRQP